MRIFLSHSSADRSAKNLVRLRLRMERLPVWDDSSFIRGGDEIDRRLEAALEDSAIFFLLWSKDADASNWVRNELAYFSNLKDDCVADRLVVPLKIDQTPLPLICSTRHCYFAEKGRIMDSDWESILRVIRKNRLII